MINLFLLNEYFTNNLVYNLLNIISLISVICGIFVIISKNPVVSVLFLIGLFLSIACYLMILGINFIGLSYLLVYVGAVSILFIFILMLINVRVSELITDNSNSISLAIITGIIYNQIFFYLLPSNVDTTKYSNLSPIYKQLDLVDRDSILNVSSNNIQFVTSHTWDSILSETSHITTIGNIIYTGYPLLLLITSIILLLAMVGAIVITINK